MADYYSILTKTISGLRDNKPELRQAVYAKARTAIEAQLRKMSPTPSEETIRSQLELLEDSIAVIESEHADSSLAPDVAAAAVAPAEPAESAPLQTETPAVAAPPPAPEPETVQEIIEPEPPVAEVAVPASRAEKAELPEPVVAGPADLDPPPEVDTQVVPENLERPVVQNKSAGAGSVLRTLVILALLGGAGYAAWLNRDALEQTVTSLLGQSGETAQQVEQAPETNTETDNAVEEVAEEKEAVRLAQDNNAVEETQPEAEPAETEINIEPVEDQTPLLTEEATGQDAVTQEQETVSEEAPEDPVVEETPESPEPVETAEEAEGAQENQSAVSAPLGEVAYLYEEGSAGSGATRSTARITWTLANVKPSEALPAEPVIVGNMEVPDKSLSVEINIKRNVDEALSASHIIEMSFVVPESFTGGEIENIARFVMKPTEEARGEPLVAVPVKVGDGFFLIALDNLDQAVQVNRNLLLNSGWIDIPVSYSTGKRALITLEKGGSGEQIFKQAFDDWQNR